MKTKLKKATYTATYDATGKVIYKNRPNGNLWGELPLGARPVSWPPTGDAWDGAKFILASDRTITVRRD